MYLQYSIGIATEQTFRYIELTDAKIWISKNASLCRVLANRVTYMHAHIHACAYTRTNRIFSHCVRVLLSC